MPKNESLNESLNRRARQIRFVEEYLVDLNATQAAIRAGYNAKTARQQASRLLANADIQATIQQRREAQSKRLEIQADAVVTELAKIGFANMLDYMRCGPDGDLWFDFSKLTRDQAAALAEVSVDHFVDGRGNDVRSVRRVRFKLADKRAALVDLGKHLGIFKPTRIELTGRGADEIKLTIDQARERNLELIQAVASRAARAADPGIAAGDPEPTEPGGN